MKSVYRALLICCLVAFSCGRETTRQLNVVLIGVDTLRPDHLGCYGYGRDTSPNIDRLARSGVLCENPVSQCPWTLPSFASVMTSLYPTQHGAGIHMNSMRTSFPTLAGMLNERGYATGAVVNVSVLSTEFGVDRGFEHYDASAPGVRRVADQVTEDALAWIDSVDDRPFFVFVHYFDPHLSYSPAAPYDTLYDPGYDGEIGNSFERETYLRMRPALFGEENEQTRADWNHIRALYDGEIAFTDEAIGDLLAGLEERGISSNTLVVLLSDHGEEFFEHRGYGHGHTLYREVIDVPLIFSLPARLPAGVRLSRQVRLVDIMPTVLDLLGFDGDTHFEGVSLAPMLTGKGNSDRVEAAIFPVGVAYSEELQRGGERKGVTAYPWKLVYDVSDGEERLYNLQQDPGETENLVRHDPDVLPMLEEMLFRGLLAMSDTWYIEMEGDGTTRIFDLEVTVEKGPGIGKIHLHTFLDCDRRIIDVGDAVHINPVASVLEVKGLEVAGLLTLAFKVEAPMGMPISFDLKIDGMPAAGKTFIGKSLKTPDGMPFSTKASRAAAESGSGPTPRPEGPYFLIWREEARYRGATRAELGEETKRELRALGYIQ
ncbi:MAG: sulfatase [Candidatus Eisenbacteria bacterium]